MYFPDYLLAANQLHILNVLKTYRKGQMLQLSPAVEEVDV